MSEINLRDMLLAAAIRQRTEADAMVVFSTTAGVAPVAEHYRQIVEHLDAVVSILKTSKD